jgi:FkbM family methyltransferase
MNSKYYQLTLGIKRSEIRRLRNCFHPTKTSLFEKRIHVISPFWYIHGLNEIFMDEVYKFHSKNKEISIIDCGANIGLSVIYFKRQHPEAKIIAFEADKDIAVTLKNNLSAFGYNDVLVVPKAVWHENTILYFQSDGAVGGQITNDPNTSTNAIEAIRLKDYLSEHVDFLKIDIEGAEYLVIRDCKDKLKNVENIFIEYHSFLKEEQKLDEILLILKEAGFKYYIKEALNNMPQPYTDDRTSHYDLQLNIFGYRL